jgi:hypothetical protein
MAFAKRGTSFYDAVFQKCIFPAIASALQALVTFSRLA